ncbi:hypothetical protein COP2_018853 [Malus domestica]
MKKLNLSKLDVSQGAPIVKDDDHKRSKELLERMTGDKEMEGLLSSRGAGAVNAEFVQDYEESDNLNSRVFRLRQPKRSASNVPQRWVSEGNPISISDLRQISKDLSKSHLQTCRYPSGWSTIMDTYLMAPSLFQPRPNRLSAMSTGL